MGEAFTKKRFIIVILAAVFSSVVIGIVAFTNSPAQKLRKQLDLGEKYLSDLDYEQAVAAFTQALKIAPDNSDAVSGITKAFSGWGGALAMNKEYELAINKMDEARKILPGSTELIDAEVGIYDEWAEYCFNEGKYDDAFRILAEGYEKLNDIRLKSKIDNLEHRKKEIEEEEKKKAKQIGIEKLYNFMLDYYNETILLGKHIYDWNEQSLLDYINSNNVDAIRFDSGDIWIQDETADLYFSQNDYSEDLDINYDNGILIGTHIEDLFKTVGLEYVLDEWPLEVGNTKVHLGYTESGEEQCVFFDVRADKLNSPFEKGLYEIQIPFSKGGIALEISLREKNLGEIVGFRIWRIYQ